MISTIIFDFDGVILESAGVKNCAFVKLFEGFPHHSEIAEYLLQNAGLSRYEKFRHIYEQLLNEPLPDEVMTTLDNRFQNLVRNEILKCPFVAGVLPFLENHYAKFHMFVVSATPQRELTSIVHDRGLARFFDGVYGAPAPKSSLLLTIQNKAKEHPGTSLFIGDTIHDYRAATEAGVHFVGLVPDGASSPFEGLGIDTVRDFDHLETIWPLRSLHA